MADKLTCVLEPGLAHPAFSFGRSFAGVFKLWNGSAFEVYNASNIALYGRALTEALAGHYTSNAAFPLGAGSGEFLITPWSMAGSSLALGDEPRGAFPIYFDATIEKLYYMNTTAILERLETPGTRLNSLLQSVSNPGQIIVEATLRCDNGTFHLPKLGAGQNRIGQDGYGGMLPGWVIVGSTPVALDLSELTSPGWLWMRNTDPVQTVLWGPDNGSGDPVDCGMMKPGEPAIFRLKPDAQLVFLVDPASEDSGSTAEENEASIQIAVLED